MLSDSYNGILIWFRRNCFVTMDIENNLKVTLSWHWGICKEVKLINSFSCFFFSDFLFTNLNSPSMIAAAAICATFQNLRYQFGSFCPSNYQLVQILTEITGVDEVNSLSLWYHFLGFPFLIVYLLFENNLNIHTKYLRAIFTSLTV